MSAPENGGVRIVHTTARSGIVVVPNLARPIAGWNPDAAKRYCVPCSRLLQNNISHQPEHHACPTCRTVHPVKTYHIYVNADGAAIVSAGVYGGLAQAGAFTTHIPAFEGGGIVQNPPFKVDAHVPNPPKQVLGHDGKRFRELKQRDKIALWHT